MTRDLPIPVLDNHMHCDPRNGEGIDAIKKFKRSGGTHLCMINKPSWHLGVEPTEGSDYETVFEETLGTVEKAREVLNEVNGDVFPLLGVHPATISRLEEELSLEEAEEIMKNGLEVAAEYVEENKAVGIKSGRPHYDVEEEVWEASNRVMKHAFSLGAEKGCPVQLHTEYESDMHDIEEMARDSGIDPNKVVKHYSPPDLKGVVPSVMSNKDDLEEAIDRGEEFLMETDYVDDSDRPGAVLGIRTVPRRVSHFLEKAEENEKYEEAMYGAHIETPERIYGVDMSI